MALPLPFALFSSESTLSKLNAVPNVALIAPEEIRAVFISGLDVGLTTGEVVIPKACRSSIIVDNCGRLSDSSNADII